MDSEELEASKYISGYRNQTRKMLTQTKGISGPGLKREVKLSP
jgi:hypothetical protein